MWGSAAINALIGICTIYQNSMKRGSISGPEFKRLGSDLIELLREMETVLERASETGPDALSLGSFGSVTSPKIEPEERARLSAKISELIAAIGARTGR